MNFAQHLLILPILIPLLAGASVLLISESHHGRRAAIALCATLAQLATAVTLLCLSGGMFPSFWQGETAVYLLGDWVAPFGIVLVLDRLSAIMLTLCSVLGLATLIYSLARWERTGVFFLPLFQFLLMGLNGAFLTGDLFNLFVFFEILLAASYGLAMHGSGAARIKAGLRYVVVNLVASLFFLVAIALIYGITGTLNMADLAQRIPHLGGEERALFDTGAALLGIVFLVKAGAWPLNFWLPATYGSAVAPIGGLFAIMTKVGIYALLRFDSLFLLTENPAPFGGIWLFYCGLATIFTGSLGMLAAQQLSRLAGYCVIVSSGVLLSVFGLHHSSLNGPALFYLVSSVMASSAFFMLIEMAERNRAVAADFLALSFEAFGLQDPQQDSDYPDEVVGVAIPAAMAFLGLSFFSCALLLTGLPPLSSFVAKLSLIAASLSLSSEAGATSHSWLFIAALLLSGLAGVISFARVGIRVFWSTERTAPRLQLAEAGPVAALITLCLLLAIGAGPAMSYFDATAQSLKTVQIYINTVLPVGPGTEEGAKP